MKSGAVSNRSSNRSIASPSNRWTNSPRPRTARLAANHSSAQLPKYASLLRSDIDGELTKGRLIRSPVPLHPLTVTSPLAALLKPRPDGRSKFRRLFDASAGPLSPNAFISYASHSYLRFAEVLDSLRQVGPGAFVLKIDIADAYRLLPIAPSDRHLVAFQFEGDFFYELCFPFGLASSPST